MFTLNINRGRYCLNQEQTATNSIVTLSIMINAIQTKCNALFVQKVKITK